MVVQISHHTIIIPSRHFLNNKNILCKFIIVIMFRRVVIVAGSVFTKHAYSDTGTPLPHACPDVACSSKQELFKKLLLNASNSTNSSASSTTETNSSETPLLPDISSDECPLDREELGRSTWGLLHTIAANYPNSPNEIDKANAANFINSLSALYPCKVCAKDFAESISLNPPE